MPGARGSTWHKQTVVACVRVAAARTARHEVRTFAKTAAGLRASQEWLVAAGCRLHARGVGVDGYVLEGS